VGVQEVRWEQQDQQGNTHFSLERGMRIKNWVQVFFLHKRIISSVKRVEFVSDRMSCVILRGRWCHILVLNVHASTEDKTDDVKDSFYEELELVFSKFFKYDNEHFISTFQCQSRQERHF
jgi:hypothetical protein